MTGQTSHGAVRLAGHISKTGPLPFPNRHTGQTGCAFAVANRTMGRTSTGWPGKSMLSEEDPRQSCACPTPGIYCYDD
jgi:hypothetical protein